MYIYEDINIYINLSVVWLSYFWQIYWLCLLQALFFLLEIDTRNQMGKMDAVKIAIFQWFL